MNKIPDNVLLLLYAALRTYGKLQCDMAHGKKKRLKFTANEGSTSHFSFDFLLEDYASECQKKLETLIGIFNEEMFDMILKK